MSLMAGCGVYLHDDNLQKQTDTVLSTYKGADVVGAMRSALDAQAQLDKTELQSVADKESADRERAVADLISTYPVHRDPRKLDFAIARLNFRVNNRITDLVGTGKFNPQDWLDLHEKIVATTSVADDLRRQLIKQQRAYADAGGTNFTSCDNFSGPDGVPEILQTAAQELKRECDIVSLTTQPLKRLQTPIDDVLNAKSGEIADVHTQLGAVEAQITAQTKSKTDALKKLQDAQQLVKNATKDPNATTTDVSNQLKNLDDVLKDVDATAGFLGGKTFSPGAALAAIQFRKTNLRDVLAASGSSNGSTAGSPASDTNRAIVGVIAGLIQLTDTSNPPSVPALSVALAYQDGLEKAVQAQLDAMTQKESFLQDEQDSLLRELEFLAVAKVAGQIATKPLTSKSCKPLGFADVFPNAHCTSAGSAAAARALVAYNLSWASGRTAAQLDDRKITQQITWEQLRSAQEAAIARVNIQTIALSEVAAFGQGGIKPETIAAFLQALGVTAIAVGVN
jgi:hypothetical protein